MVMLLYIQDVSNIGGTIKNSTNVTFLRRIITRIIKLICNNNNLERSVIRLFTLLKVLLIKTISDLT